VSSVYSPKLLELGGPVVEGIYTQSNFFPGDLRPEEREFVTRFQTKYGHEPDSFNAGAYNSMTLVHALVTQ
jgi:branched-chain amino acid transport system substrate-binding protein